VGGRVEEKGVERTRLCEEDRSCKRGGRKKDEEPEEIITLKILSRAKKEKEKGKSKAAHNVGRKGAPLSRVRKKKGGER